MWSYLKANLSKYLLSFSNLFVDDIGVISRSLDDELVLYQYWLVCYIRGVFEKCQGWNRIYQDKSE